MITRNGTPTVDERTTDERTTCYKKSHSLRVFSNGVGGYVVTCDNCDLRTTIPVGERLKGWSDDSNADTATEA